MKRQYYSEIKGNNKGFFLVAGLLAVILLFGLYSALTMEHMGHWITGMNNQVVWGIPHVFAIFLIVAASGALNVASIGTVFNKSIYKPLGRLSGLVALALLMGGLTVLVLDLGRPDRLIVAMTKYNFKSIFAWNIFLYVGFIVIVAIYLWMYMERKMNRFAHTAGLVAFIWRLILTTGTGSIFGFLVAREAFNSALMAPMFIAMSFSFGLAIFSLVLVASAYGDDREVGDVLIKRLGYLLGVFVAVVLYFTTIQHLTNLYIAKGAGIESFILRDGGIFTELFWLVQVLIGGILPLILLFTRLMANQVRRLMLSSILVIIGGFTQIYVLIIGGQVYPQNLFPGKIVSSDFYDGIITQYNPSIYEIGLGLGGIALALLIIMVGLKFLQFLPNSLANIAIDPHHSDNVKK